MEQAILTTTQKKVIELVGREPRLASIYLTGGTALAAYYLLHRFSDDLDFFYSEQLDILFLHEFIKDIQSTIGANKVIFDHIYDRNQFLFITDNGELKVEFVKYSFTQIEPPIMRDGMRIDSIRDIAANKLMALIDRFEPKDFIDLFFLLQDRKLEEVRSDAEKKFDAKIGDIFLGSEFAKVRRIQILPRMIKPVTIDELKEFFGEQAKKLSPYILDQ